MKPQILNKRKVWIIDKEEKNLLKKWSENADKLANSKDYFGIKGGVGIAFEKDEYNTNCYFEKSLKLFKTVVELQKSDKASGLPKLTLPEKYDALISIVGFSPQPLLHTILTLAPEHVYPIVTVESATHYGVANILVDQDLAYFKIIVDLYKEPDQNITIEPIGRAVESIGSLDTFKRVREIIQIVRHDNPTAKIAIDITGGKKSADASAFLTAAIEKKIDIYYVDFEDYTDNKACCGTEFLNKLDNPYHIYNVQLLNQAKELFKTHNYSGANDLFKVVLNKLDDVVVTAYNLEKEREAIKKMQNATECYMYWDRFDYAQINTSVLTAQQSELLDDKPYFKVLDYLLNAKRRYSQGCYHDGIVRLFQIVEYLVVKINPIYANIPSKDNRIVEAIDDYKEIPIYLRNKLHSLRDKRNKFIHKNATIGNKVFNDGVINVIELIALICKKSIKQINLDINKYAFPIVFKDDGSL